jgi:hypothetical protein
MGDFTQLVGGDGTTFQVNIGDSYLTKVTGSIPLTSAIARGEYIKIAGTVYRVATDTTMTFSSNMLPLATAGDPSKNTTFSGIKNYTTLPIYMPDTSLGCISVNPGDSTITTRWTASSAVNDIRDVTNGFKISRGDLIRLGDPFSGEIFRISTDMDRATGNLQMPLGTPEDPSVESSFDPVDGKAIIDRPAYKLQTTGPISFDATASQMKASIEALSLIGEVDVERYIANNGFTWKITHTSDRGSRTKFIPNTYLTLAAPGGRGVRVLGHVEKVMKNLQTGPLLCSCYCVQC